MKLIGFLLVVVGSAVFGFSESYSLSLRHKELLDLEQSFLRLEGEVCRMLRPMSEALRCAGVGRAETLFFCAAEKLETGSSAPNAWSVAVDEYLKVGHLIFQDGEILDRFGEGIGAEDEEGQKRNISLLRTLLAVQEKEAEEVKKKQGKLYSSGGILVGLMIGIILL